MQTVTILCVGKLKETYWREASAEYQKRLGAFCKIKIVEIEEERLPQNPSQAQIDGGILAEGQRMLAKIPADSLLIALCIEGKTISSEELAKTMEDAAIQGKSSLCFCIGGSFGLDARIKKQASIKLSMSPMTFPHQLARIMLLEQVYRGYQILSGGKYHK